MVALMISTVFCGFALAETPCGTASAYVSGDDTITVTTTDKPTKVKITVSNCSNTYGEIFIQNSNGVDVASSISIGNSNTTYERTISFFYRKQGTYNIVIDMTGSANFTVTFYK